MQKLYGNPDDYAYKFENDTFVHKLPIHQTRVYFNVYDFFHSISIDYSSHRVYYSNHYHERLEYGMFVHDNDTRSYYYGDVPDTNQVTKRSAFNLLGYDVRIVCEQESMLTSHKVRNQETFFTAR